MVDTLIIGGGITGLTAAYRRKKQGKTVLLLEKEERLGGWIQGRREPYFFEKGPRSLREGRIETLDLLEELGLGSRVLLGREKRRYLLQGGKLREVPTTLFGVATTPWVWPWLPTFLKGMRGVACAEDESIASYFSRRFSPAFVEAWIDPMVAGIWGGDPHELSMKSCFPSLPKGGKQGLYTLRGGLSELVEALARRLEGAIRTGTVVKKLTYERDHWRVETSQGIFQAQEVIATLPAFALAPLIGEPELEKIRYLSITTVHLGYKENLLPREGFGYLVPRREKESVLGVVWDSSAFPEQNTRARETRLTAMIGGEKPDGEGVAREAIGRHLGIAARPDWVDVAVHKKAIPQFVVGHQKWFASLRETIGRSHPKLVLAGSYCSGVSVHDCICYGLAV